MCTFINLRDKVTTTMLHGETIQHYMTQLHEHFTKLLETFYMVNRYNVTWEHAHHVKHSRKFTM